MTKNIKLSSLLSSTVAIIVLFSMLIGSTFAWFTDSVTSSGNIIKSGNLDVEMFWADGKEDPTNADWKDASTGAIFNYDRWEPGYTEVRHIKIDNVGTLALKYKVQIVANGEVSDLSDVIDVYYADPAVQVANRSDLADENKLGTLTQALEEMGDSATGELIAGENHTVTLALKMKESAGNEYANKSIGTDFSIQLYATQLSSESDSYGSDYDANAKYVTPTATLEAFFTAIDNGDDVVLNDQISVNAESMNYVQTRYGRVETCALGDETEVVNTNFQLNGNGITVYRSAQLLDKPIFAVDDGYTLTISNIVLDGGAKWTGEVNKTLCRGTENAGLTTTASIIALGLKSHVVLEKGAIVQNNDGAVAINLNTRVGSTLTVNGGEILNNHSAAGAIWGGGETVVNSGKINYNHGGIGGAIRVVTNIGTVLTMNGGEMNHNYSDGVGGAIWAGSSKSNNVYVLNGGEMAYNESPVGGGAIYAGYYETVKIGGTFKMHHNVSPFAPAIRFHDHASFVMTGGEIYDNGENSLFLYNNSASITGGVIKDAFGYSGGLGLTLGNAQVTRVDYNLSTNHNTAYLATEFGVIEFTVNESAANFANFNFAPASGYVYVEGDENKLVCLNEGYVTYWDDSTKTFRLKTNA